jgi:hypothetical protein
MNIIPGRVLVDSSYLQYGLWRAISVALTPNPAVAKGPYRPYVWGAEQPKTFITDSDGVIYYFDAVLRNDHTETQRITQHPVQSGASMTDHSFSLPSQLSLEIGMSDVMDSYTPGQWGTDQSEPTRSVKAYQTILKWKKLGMPLTISTRLGEYQNMIVAMVTTPDDIRTLHGLRCQVTFQQILTYTIEVTKVPLRPAAVTTNNVGTKPAKSTDANRNSKLYNMFGTMTNMTTP